MSKTDTQVINIDGEDLIIDEEGEGELVFSEDTEGALTILKEEEIGGLPDPLLKEWARSTVPDPRKYPTESEGFPIDHPDPPGTHRQCRNCPSITPPNLSTGLPRIFCSNECSHRYHSKLYNKRNRTKRGWHLEVEGTYQAQFYRKKPIREAHAELYYRSHLEKNMCPNGTEDTQYRCPAHMLKDPYSTKKLCLIYAVLVDDMKEIWARNAGLRYIRQFTTNDGRWLDNSELDVHEEPDKGIIRGEKRGDDPN